ncbi:D-alanyl-D-alanine carboxypeptidase family protein [Frigoribacterium sp. MCBA15_019]|uniref:M15 family metallopeptidase n=1 Tax=Frigoribacterium sp. MCBA15_019 TaxID=1898745 RepID=UPI0009F59265|nr:M15 family metallopeptidase [Frigoribacterium sp. MCBA15_019]
MAENGRLATADLMAVPASVSGSGFLRRDAASQYGMLAYAFREALGQPLVITEGYRDYTRQLEYWRKYQAGTGNLAAYPGSSNHGLGISCDFGSGVASFGTAAKRWMDANAPAYGWKPTGNSFSRPEAWHYDYVGDPRITRGPSIFDTPAATRHPVPEPPKEHDMDLVAVILDVPSAKTDPAYASTGVLVGGRFTQTSSGYAPRGAFEAMKDVARRHGGRVQDISVDRVGWNQYALYASHDSETVDASALATAVLAGLDGKLAADVDTSALAAEVAGKVADTLAARLKS